MGAAETFGVVEAYRLGCKTEIDRAEGVDGSLAFDSSSSYFGAHASEGDPLVFESHLAAHIRENERRFADDDARFPKRTGSFEEETFGCASGAEIQLRGARDHDAVGTDERIEQLVVRAASNRCLPGKIAFCQGRDHSDTKIGVTFSQAELR